MLSAAIMFLIVTSLQGEDRVDIETVEFLTKERCIQAGEQLVKDWRRENAFGIVVVSASYTCVGK